MSAWRQVEMKSDTLFTLDANHGDQLVLDTGCDDNK